MLVSFNTMSNRPNFQKGATVPFVDHNAVYLSGGKKGFVGTRLEDKFNKLNAAKTSKKGK